MLYTRDCWYIQRNFLVSLFWVYAFMVYTCLINIPLLVVGPYFILMQTYCAQKFVTHVQSIGAVFTFCDLFEGSLRSPGRHVIAVTSSTFINFISYISYFHLMKQRLILGTTLSQGLVLLPVFICPKCQYFHTKYLHR